MIFLMLDPLVCTIFHNMLTDLVDMRCRVSPCMIDIPLFACIVFHRGQDVD